VGRGVLGGRVEGSSSAKVSKNHLEIYVRSFVGFSVFE